MVYSRALLKDTMASTMIVRAPEYLKVKNMYLKEKWCFSRDFFVNFKFWSSLLTKKLLKTFKRLFIQSYSIFLYKRSSNLKIINDYFVEKESFSLKKTVLRLEFQSNISLHAEWKMNNKLAKNLFSCSLVNFFYANTLS